MRHDKLQEWAGDTTNEDDPVIPHQSRADRMQTPSQQRTPDMFPQDNDEEIRQAFETEEEFEDDGEQITPLPDEFEVKARQMGWVPKEDWRGDPDDWTPAKRFVQTGEMIQANRALHQKVQYMENDFNQRLANMRQLHEAQLKSNLDTLKAQRDAAVEMADTEKYQSLNKQIEMLEQTANQMHQPMQGQFFGQQPQQQMQLQPDGTQAQPVQQQQQQPVLDPQAAIANLINHPVVTQWRMQNPWINQDTPKTAYAERQFMQWVNSNIQNPTATIEQGLLFVEEAVDREFPNTNPNRERSSMTEKRGGPARKSANLTLTMNDLTREERLIWQTMGNSWKNQKEFLQAVQDDREANR